MIVGPTGRSGRAPPKAPAEPLYRNAVIARGLGVVRRYTAEEVQKRADALAASIAASTKRAIRRLIIGPIVAMKTLDPMIVKGEPNHDGWQDTGTASIAFGEDQAA